MTEGKYGYKLDVLRDMLEHENKDGYGACLTHWASNAGPINLDDKALKCLIRHYARRNSEVRE